MSETPVLSQTVANYSAFLVQSCFCPHTVACAALNLRRHFSLGAEALTASMGNINYWELVKSLFPLEGRYSTEKIIPFKEADSAGRRKQGALDFL